MKRGFLSGTLFLCLAAGGFAQKMTVADSESHVLMEVNDEGTVGSIMLPDSTLAPVITTDKLYNVSGVLYWNGSALGTAGSAGGWTKYHEFVYLTESEDMVGIGTKEPEFKLSLDQDGGILAKGVEDEGRILPDVGTGARFIWYPRRAALRSGYTDADQWDDVNIGDNSVATGWQSVAKGNSSVAMGALCDAEAQSSFACGYDTRCYGVESFATGHESFSYGNFSIAMGLSTRANSYCDLAIGRYNLTGSGTTNSWISTEPLVEIGNGVDATHRANAVTVLKNGNVGIGTTTPQGPLDVNGAIFQRGSVLHADYVFEEDYQLESIEEHSDFMWKNKHLKAVPKMSMDEAGHQIIEVGANQRGIVEELEKAHIYIHQLYEKVQLLEEKNLTLEKRITQIK